MQTTPAELTTILGAIERLRDATGTEIIMTSNETVRDGSRVMLESSEGWFIDIVGGRLYESYEYPPLGLLLRGYIYNPKTNILEALTLHPGTVQGTRGEVQIENPAFDFVAWVQNTMVPAVQHSAKLLHDAWAQEAERKALTAQLQAHFAMDSTSKKFTRGLHTVEISVGPTSSNWKQIGLSLKADGLSTTQLEAILKLLDDSPATPATAG
jgi:hypothetical protein